MSMNEVNSEISSAKVAEYEQTNNTLAKNKALQKLDNFCVITAAMGNELEINLNNVSFFAIFIKFKVFLFFETKHIPDYI